MSPPRVFHNTQDRDTFWTLISFLDDRLAEQGTIDWALKLKPEQRIERLAIIELLTGPTASELAEPWQSAWHLIKESWLNELPDDQHGAAIYDIQRRFQASERSNVLVAEIVNLVAPHLKVEALNDWRYIYTQRPRRPKKVQHVLLASLSSGDLIDLNVLHLAQMDDVAFLRSLANALEVAVNHGLDIARRFGWNEDHSLIGLGMLNRVYYTQMKTREGGNSESDAFNKGIAPSVKLLYAVVDRISVLDKVTTLIYLQRWKLECSPVHIRLWAALSRNVEIMPTAEVLNFLMGLDDQHFWNLHEFPEIAELRALRFNEFDHSSRVHLTARLQQCPPRNHWPKKSEKNQVARARQYWACRELRRIEVAGGVLPVPAKKWLDARQHEFSELEEMTIDEGFLDGPRVRDASSNPDRQYNEISGVVRLKALEEALGTGRVSWDNDPAEGANGWIHQEGNASKVLVDFEETQNGGKNFPMVWERFGWAHKPNQNNDQGVQIPNRSEEASRVLAQLDQHSEETFSASIQGICAWLDAWDKHIVKLPQTLRLWLRVWPIAVARTNQEPERVNDADLSVAARFDGDEHEPPDLDTLNTPAGKLVGVFLAACPRLGEESFPFTPGSMERQMRDSIIMADGRSILIAKYRMIQALPYFLSADHEWTQDHLITPLHNEDAAALALWRAVARRTHFKDVLKIIGELMTERVNDRRLGRETRSRLVFSLVVESLHAFREGRDAVLPNPRIQQMLRMLDDEVRAEAATAVNVFVRDLSVSSSANTLEDRVDGNKPSPAAVLFRNAAAPFLREVWPQERSLATPGISRALADLPATSAEAFSEVVNTIERFLVPFECWSMLDYGLDGNEGSSSRSSNLAMIDDESKAEALLRLLDLTIGRSEGAVVPYDLADALNQIRSVSPASANSSVFRRLETASRR
ncbi:MAG: hypothetical protein OXI17_09690 [Gammaproteobacteria bacterium]|nr:hypothetical protein [Gammaproteobacteria bacterium]